MSRIRAILAQARPLFRDRTVQVGGALLLACVLFSLVVPFGGVDPYHSDFAHGIDAVGEPIPPSTGHWLGTDRLFRDEATRLALAGRHSLRIGLLATAIASAVGTLVGLIAGWTEGGGFSQAGAPGIRRRLREWSPSADTFLSFLIDVGLSFPFLLLVMALAAAAERTNETTIVLTLGFSGWLSIARLVRSRVLELRHRDFVTAARAFGQSTFRIFLLHLLPNVASTVVITGTLAVGQMIVAEAALSWLGAGLSPPEPSWGRMLAEGQEVFPASPWLLLAPMTMLVASAIGFNLIGEGLRDRLEERRAGASSAPTADRGTP